MKKNKVIALVLALILLLASIPVSRMNVKADTIAEGTKMIIKVVDLDDKEIDKGLTFKINDNEEAVVPECADKKYTIDISGQEAENLTIKVIMGDIIKTVEYDPDHIGDYELPFYGYPEVSNDGVVFDENTETYTVDVPYDIEKKYEILGDVSIVEGSIESNKISNDEEDDLYNYDDTEEVNDRTVCYRTPGYIKMKLNSTKTPEFNIYKSVNLVLNITNKPEFREENNNNNNDVTCIYEDSLVKEVTMTGIKEWNGLNLTAPYPAGIEYTGSNNDAIEVDNTGAITIKKNSGYDTLETTITAKCKYTNEQTTYLLRAVPPESYMDIWVNNRKNPGSIEVEAADYLTDTLPVTIGNGYKNVSYKSGNEEIAEVDNSGNITIKKCGEVTITVNASKENEWKKYTRSFTLRIRKSQSEIKVYYNGQETDPQNAIEISENDVFNEKIELPITLSMTDKYDEAIANPIYSPDSHNAYSITIGTSKITINNTNDIERNAEFTVKINSRGYDNDWAYESASVTLKFIIKGEIIDNSSIYSVEWMDGDTASPLRTVKIIDGITTRWALSNTVKITVGNADEYLLSTQKDTTKFESLTISASGAENYNKDHAFWCHKYTEDSHTYTMVHEYYGTDLADPVLSLVSSDKIIVTKQGLYAGETATFKVHVHDDDGHLHSVELIDTETNEVIKTVNIADILSETNTLTDSEVEFTLPFAADTVKKLKVVVWDQAARSVETTLVSLLNGSVIEDTYNTLIFDDKAAADSVDVSVPEGVKKHTAEDGTIYVSGEAGLVITSTEPGQVFSGVKNITVNVNGVERTYDISDTGIFSVNGAKAAVTLKTEDFMTDMEVENGSRHLTVKVTSMDNAGNESEVSVYNIYIDKSVPEIKEVSVVFDDEENGRETRTEYGNFYNGPFTLLLDIEDAMSGLAGAVLTVGETAVTGYLSDGKIAFDLNSVHAGQAELVLTDKVGNIDTVKYSDITEGYKSSLIVVDPDAAKPVITVVTEESNEGWYNTDVEFTVKTEEPSFTTPSGIKKVTITVTGRKNGEVYEYNSTNVTKPDAYTVKITKDMVNEDNIPDGKYTVKADVYDNAGNHGEASVTVMIDRTGPSALYLATDTTGTDNVTDFGNFYNKETTVNISVSDKVSKVKSAVMTIGDKEYNAVIKGQTASFTFSEPAYGDAGITITDTAGNVSVYELVRLRGEDNTLIFRNNYIICESQAPEVSITVNTEPNKNGWYNTDVEFTVKAEDPSLKAPSGINKVMITVTGRDKSEVHEYSGTDVIKPDAYTVKITKDMINETAHPDGKYTVKADVYDNAGNHGEASVTVLIDRTAPTAGYLSTETKGTDNVTDFGNFYNNQTTVNISVSDRVSKLESAVMAIGDKKYNAVINGQTASFTFSEPADGDTDITITDAAGNVSVYELVRLRGTDNLLVFRNNYIICESQAPAVSVTENAKPNENGWYNGEVTLTTVVKDGSLASGISEVVITVNNKSYDTIKYNNRTTDEKTYSIVIDKEWINDVINDDGSYTVKVSATDNSGNTATAEKVLYIDTVTPVIGELTGVISDSSNTGTVTINVPVSEKHFGAAGNRTLLNVKKELDGVVSESVVSTYKPVMADNVQSFTFTEDGTYTITVESKDAAGNSAVEKSISFIIDNTNPVVSISGVTEGSCVKDSVVLEFNAVESNYKDNTVTIEGTRTLNGRTTETVIDKFISNAKNSTLKQIFNEEGDYEITIKAADSAGNNAKPQTIRFTIDTEAPAITVDGITNASYQGELAGIISVSDNYYESFSLSLIRSVVNYDHKTGKVNIIDKSDVTSQFTGEIIKETYGEKVSLEIPKEQNNDGLYILTVTAKDRAGRETSRVVEFTVNRYGSVYTFSDNFVKLLNNPYVQAVTSDVIITEYNTGEIDKSAVSVQITRDGVLLENPDYEIADKSKGSEWHEYEYIIRSSNFNGDGIYKISVSSVDSDGIKSETIKYDSLLATIYVDTTKPELVSVLGLDGKNFNTSSLDVNYELFDAIGIKSVEVYLNGIKTAEITEIEELTRYLGSFTVEEGMNQQIRLVITDLAGNVTDTDNAEDDKYVADFNREITVSTNFFIRWYANKAVFIGSIAGFALLVAGITTLIVVRGKKKKLS